MPSPPVDTVHETDPHHDLTVVLSVFNEANGLEAFWSELEKHLTGTDVGSVEILWVNDGSEDESLRVLRTIKSREQTSRRIHRIVSLSRNFGHEAAMIAGIDLADGRTLICMDSDLQHPPAKLGEMLMLSKRGFDIVLTERRSRDDGGTFKRWCSSLFYALINRLSTHRLRPGSTDFFLVSQRVADVLRREYREQNRFLRGYLQCIGFRVGVIEYEAPPRAFGRSTYSLRKLFGLAVTAVFSFSNRPLRLSIAVALLFSAATVGIGVYSLYMYFVSDQRVLPSGYTTIVLFLSASFSLLFTLLSIFFVYFEKTLEETRQRPIYIIESIDDG